jgi:hypothetical protein
LSPLTYFITTEAEVSAGGSLPTDGAVIWFIMTHPWLKPIKTAEELRTFTDEEIVGWVITKG